MQHTLWICLHAAAVLGLALSVAWMLWSAAKDRPFKTLVAGGLSALCGAVFPAVRLSGLAASVSTAIQEDRLWSPFAEGEPKRVVITLLWLIVLTVPGPFIGVGVQFLFRLARRLRAARTAP